MDEKHDTPSSGDEILSYVKYYGSTLFTNRDIWNKLVLMVKGREGRKSEQNNETKD